MTQLTDTRFYIRTQHDPESTILEGFFKYEGINVVALIDSEWNISIHKVGKNNQPLKTKLLAGTVSEFTSKDKKAPQFTALLTNPKVNKAFRISIWQHTGDNSDIYYSANMQPRQIRQGQNPLATKPQGEAA